MRGGNAKGGQRRNNQSYDIDEDWWYLKTITIELDGEKWILDYWDVGWHEGSDNEYWFKNEEAQKRAKSILQECEGKVVEVWT